MDTYCKMAYKIRAEVVEPGAEVYNYLEDSMGIADMGHDIKLIGTVGEEWLIARDKLPVKYTYSDGEPIDTRYLPKGVFEIAAIPGGEIVWAEQVYDQQEVQTAWGEVLKTNRDGVEHGGGDYIVYEDLDGRPNLNNRWVVNGAVFETTYEYA